MANSTTIITDLGTVITNNNTAVQAATAANAVNPTALSATGGAGNMTGTTGVYASGTYYGGMMDYLGMLEVARLKAKELAIIVQKLLVNTDHGTDSTNGDLLAKILNDLQ